MAYTCYDEECRARKVLTNTGLVSIQATHVLHLPMKKMYQELKYLNLMKESCRTEPHSVGVSTIFEKIQAL